MDSHLERLRRELEDAIRGVAASADANGPAQAPPGKWSATEILEHLFLTYQGTNRGLAKCLERGASLATHPALKHRMATLLVVNFGYLPSGRKSPERATPRGMPVDEVRQAIVKELDRMAAGLNECERKFGAGTKIMDHPSLGPLTAGEWRKFHRIHGRHHLRQIRERMGKG